MKVPVFIEKCEDGYSALMEYCEKLNLGLSGSGETIEKAISDFLHVRDEMKRFFKNEGMEFPSDLEFDFRYQVATVS